MMCSVLRDRVKVKVSKLQKYLLFDKPSFSIKIGPKQRYRSQ